MGICSFDDGNTWITSASPHQNGWSLENATSLGRITASKFLLARSQTSSRQVADIFCEGDAMLDWDHVCTVFSPSLHMKMTSGGDAANSGCTTKMCTSLLRNSRIPHQTIWPMRHIILHEKLTPSTTDTILHEYWRPPFKLLFLCHVTHIRQFKELDLLMMDSHPLSCLPFHHSSVTCQLLLCTVVQSRISAPVETPRTWARISISLNSYQQKEGRCALICLYTVETLFLKLDRSCFFCVLLSNRVNYLAKCKTYLT